METSLFTSEFVQSTPESIASEIKDHTGFVIFENAVSPRILSNLLNNISINEYLVNNNTLGFVRAENVNFLSHTLGVSKECYDIITSEKVRAICRHFFDDSAFKLSNQRIYETHTRGDMAWHTDNNLQDGNTFKGKHNLPGILFLFYLSDVSEVNPFQLISGSHKWSAENTGRFFTNKYIQQNHEDDMKSVKGPRGTLVICNTHLIHRAEPFNVPGFKRLTFLFQVDALSAEHVGHGEKLLINPSFVNDTNPEILDYLGFGMQTDYPTFPHTSVETMLASDILKLQKSILPKAVKGLGKAIIKGIIPPSLLTVMKNFKFSKESGKIPAPGNHTHSHSDHYH